MSSYKRPILLNILQDLYPDIQSNCDTTYASIIFATPQQLVPEQTIIDLYPSYVQKYNLGILRRERQNRLVPTDYCGLADYPFPNAEKKQAWLTYRQELRTITDRYPNPEVDENDKLIGVTWPVKPSA
jgi:hypothetical protein